MSKISFAVITTVWFGFAFPLEESHITPGG